MHAHTHTQTHSYCISTSVFKEMPRCKSSRVYFKSWLHHQGAWDLAFSAIPLFILWVSYLQLSLLDRGTMIRKQAQNQEGSVSWRNKAGVLLGTGRRIDAERKREDSLLSWVIPSHHCVMVGKIQWQLENCYKHHTETKMEMNCLCPGGQLFQLIKKPTGRITWGAVN